jgi:hypothetical protein
VAVVAVRWADIVDEAVVPEEEVDAVDKLPNPQTGDNSVSVHGAERSMHRLGDQPPDVAAEETIPPAVTGDTSPFPVVR